MIILLKISIKIMPKYTPIIGLEIHVELKTKSKMFCRCKNSPDRDAPNTNICEVCLAHPGTLPVPNQTAIEWTVKIAKALGCQINEYSKFDRKHYFYPDLPKAYQISQYDLPVGEHGGIDLEFLSGKNHREKAKIGITRVHLEEDTAKLTHANDGSTLSDFNRAGVPLVEIVSDPDAQSALEAKTYCQELQAILRYLEVSDADMEKGHMRCEANISIQEEGKFEIVNGLVKPLDGYILNNKVEVKNINSFTAVEKAIEFETKRQIELIEKGETWGPQTRGWNADKGETVLQRVKESAADYRYFPEPDIPPFHPLKIAGDCHLPELPAARRLRFHQEYGFSYADAHILTVDKDWAKFAEEVYSELINWVNDLKDAKFTATAEKSTAQLAKLTGGWLTTKLAGAMSEKKIDIKILKIKPENFAELIALIFTNRLNSTNAQKVLNEMLDANSDIDPTHIMEEKGYGQITDEKQLGKVVDEVVKNNPKQVEQFKAGKEPILQFLKGMVMKATEGSADPVITEKLLREKLK
jgi:aspartyl-tRNA(Asn)/glutamyl-tRNA(Gln) amidotransferase subunit B